jgi:predicted membrane protein
MRLKKTTLSSLVSFLLGAGWGIAFLGAFSMFFSFLHANIFIALVSTVIGAVPGLLMVVFLEYLLLKSEMLSQLKRQTYILEEIQKKQK